jgi:hypothetical protein
MSQVRPADADIQAREALDGAAPEARADRKAIEGRPGRWALWPAAMAAVVRRHWLAAALLTAGLVLRVAVQFAYRPALFYIDTTRYLYNAEGMDPVGYKGPLRAILWLANFDAVAAIQHLLGLAVAVLIYLVLLRRGVPRWLAALAIAPAALDAYQLQAEQTVLPTAWFEALTVAGLAILLWAPKPSWRRVVAAGVVLGTSATFAQVGEALLVPAAIYLLAAGGGWRRAVGKAAVVCGAFALPILAYCAGSYLLTGDFFLSHTGVTSFYGRAAAAVDCATIKLPADERGMCPTKAEQAKGPDWLEYGDRSPIRPYYANLPRAETDSLISDFNHRVLTQQPGQLAAAYGRDVVKVFALTRDGSPGDTPISRWQFQTSYPTYGTTIFLAPDHTIMLGLHFATSGGPEIVQPLPASMGGQASVVRPLAGFLRGYQLHGGYPPGPLLALATVAGLFGTLAVGALALARRRRPGLVAERRAAQQQLALACLLVFGAAAAVLLASDAFEFSWRYQLPALVTLPPAGALGIALGISFLRRPRTAARGPDASSGSDASDPDSRGGLARAGQPGKPELTQPELTQPGRTRTPRADGPGAG